MAPTPPQLKLNQTEDYLTEMQTLAGSASRDLHEVDTEMRTELAEMRDRLERHVDRLRSGGQALDWDDEESKQAYLDEISAAAETVEDRLERLDGGTETLSDDEVETLRDALQTLLDCTHGQQEDFPSEVAQ